MALPSLVILIPPIGSRIIFNMEEGPRTEERIEAIAVAAWMLDKAVLSRETQEDMGVRGVFVDNKNIVEQFGITRTYLFFWFSILVFVSAKKENNHNGHKRA